MMSTWKQIEYIRALAKKKDLTTTPENLQPSLDAILGGGSFEISVSEASKIIDALAASPLAHKMKAPTPVVMGEDGIFVKAKKQGKIKPPGFWSSPNTKAVLECVNIGTYSMADAASMLDTHEHKVREYAGKLRTNSGIYDPEWKGYKKSKSGKTVVITSEFEGVSQHQIDWAGFMGLVQMERFDLKVICSHFYAAQRLTTAKKIVPELYDLKQAGLRYITTWAERFAKYTLAACLGEFGHRRFKGELPVGRSRLAGSESGCQGQAEGIWDKGREVATKAARVMEEEFNKYGNFRGGYGGPKWAKIAKTLRIYLDGTLPAELFADYVWDLSHNGGRFFDKCPLFYNESETRHLLTKKKASQVLDVLPWAADYLHPSWKEGLETLEAISEDKAPRGMRSLQGLDLIGGDE